MRISDWSSDVCSSDLALARRNHILYPFATVLGERTIEALLARGYISISCWNRSLTYHPMGPNLRDRRLIEHLDHRAHIAAIGSPSDIFLEGSEIIPVRSEEHTSELQSLMRISYAVFCLKKKNTDLTYTYHYIRPTITTTLTLT